MASIPLDGDWMVVGKDAGKAVTDQLVAAIGLHRAWARAEAVMASSVLTGLTGGAVPHLA